MVMADTSNRRREPGGIPTGGQFADEARGAADASDLERADLEPRALLPGGMAVGDGWTQTTPTDRFVQPGQCEFADGEGGRLRTYDTDWFDPNLGDCSSRRAEYISPRGDTAVAHDMKVETEGRADISVHTPDGLKRAVDRARRALTERAGIEPERVEVEMGERPDGPMRARAFYPMLEEPAGFHPLKARRARLENERRAAMDDWVEVEP